MLSLENIVLPHQSTWEIFQDKQGDQVCENALHHPLFVYMPRKNSQHAKWNVHGGDKNLLWLRRLFHLSKQWGQTAGAISENDSPRSTPRWDGARSGKGEKHRLMRGEGSEFSFDFAEMILDLLICHLSYLHFIPGSFKAFKEPYFSPFNRSSNSNLVSFDLKIQILTLTLRLTDGSNRYDRYIKNDFSKKKVTYLYPFFFFF